MIAEVLLVLTGHTSSLFTADHAIQPAFVPLLHPGEQQCLQALGQIASRYHKVKTSTATLSRSPSRYIAALSAALSHILKDEYEALVIDTESKILARDPAYVGSASFVPLSSIRACFSEWDAPLAALESLIDQLEEREEWKPGPLIDMLLARSHTGVHRIADILSRLSIAVQRVWRTQLTAFLVHGSLAPIDPLASDTYSLLEGSMPSCVSIQSRDSIAYVGRAIGTVKAAKWARQLPRDLAMEHTKLLEGVLPEEQHEFDRVVTQIRTNVSEWLWLNVLTQKDVEDAVDSLANYFLQRNGEFSLSLIREIERLKLSRFTNRSGATSMIREQDLNLALLRASLGTTAQHDPSLSYLRFNLPSGPIRPLLPSLSTVNPKSKSKSTNPPPQEATQFDDLLLGTRLHLTYAVSWPLDLFLHPSDLQIYAALFSYLSSLRKTHTRIHTCWASLSNAQRARRRWTGLGEGGTAEDVEVRRGLLRCGWGVVRDMGWFLDTLLGYVMTHVVDIEFRRLKELLGKPGGGITKSVSAGKLNAPAEGNDATSSSTYLDFTTLRNIHTTYLERLLTGCLLSNPALTAIIRSIFEVCERFVAQVERWGGDVLPALLFEGSLAGDGAESVGALVKERWGIVAEINGTLHTLFEAFYEQLSLSTSQRPFTATQDASKSILMNASITNASGFHHHTTTTHSTFIRRKANGGNGGMEGEGEVRRHIERLLLRLDFNGGFSGVKRRKESPLDGEDEEGEEILKQGGL